MLLITLFLINLTFYIGRLPAHKIGNQISSQRLRIVITFVTVQLTVSARNIGCSEIQAFVWTKIFTKRPPQSLRVFHEQVDKRNTGNLKQRKSIAIRLKISVITEI